MSRDLTLLQAAQAGAIDLDAKGGPEGGAVSMVVKHKKLGGPINVTVRVEFTVAPRITLGNRQLTPCSSPPARTGWSSP